MAEPLKYLYNTAFFETLQAQLATHAPTINWADFERKIFTQEWDALELKERMQHLTRCFHELLPGTFRENAELLAKIMVPGLELQYLSCPDYIATYGVDDPEFSLNILQQMTPLATAEFAVRPFIIEHEQLSMEFLMQCAQHENHHIRRWASEGCRPRLPWGMALPRFKNDPSLILPILEQLREDSSEYVRRSVANNLNDISKDNPEVVLEIAERWLGISKDTDRLVKHALRTLLKAGNPKALMYFGFGDPSSIEVLNLTMSNRSPKIGESVSFAFDLSSENPIGKTRVEFAVHYMKSNGKQRRKVFQLSEKEIATKAVSFSKNHSFEERTTRKHYPGEHQLEIIVNGVGKAFLSFELKS